MRERIFEFALKYCDWLSVCALFTKAVFNKYISSTIIFIVDVWLGFVMFLSMFVIYVLFKHPDWLDNETMEKMLDYQQTNNGITPFLIDICPFLVVSGLAFILKETYMSFCLIMIFILHISIRNIIFKIFPNRS